jgi:hypothetical protein
MQQNGIYNIPLPRGPGPKNKTQKKGNESGINYPGELKKRRILHGDTKYLLGTLFARSVRFEKLNKSDLPPSTARASPFHPRYISAFQQRRQLAKITNPIP